MVVAIASTRKPKVDAVKSVFERFAQRLGASADELVFLNFDVASGVEETPKSLERILQGARSRAVTLRERFRAEKKEMSFAVGLEGGLFSVDDTSSGRQTFLQSWACVAADGQESFGASGAILLPRAIADAVVEDHQSLSDVIDRTAMQTDVRSKQGTWGVLSQDVITRQASFETALTSALAPFYNRIIYQAR